MGQWAGALEGMEMKPSFWQGRRVFLTGHTGFKGGWLALWLSRLGAEVVGYSLAPPSTPALFDLLDLQARLFAHQLADIRDLERLKQAVRHAQPEVVFHLAAQPLVRASYRSPIETCETNIMGTANLLEALRDIDSVRAVVVVTSDKCYENREWLWPYRENEALGGHDPYSASKAAAEIVTAAYRRSFFGDTDCAVATARAGNVIGGGDFAEDRLLPDLFRSQAAGELLHLRYPQAVRPWQHVLEPLRGYLMLAERLWDAGRDYVGAWNFGPEEADIRTVSEVVESLAHRLPKLRWTQDDTPQPHEAGLLRLDSSQARLRLDWRPVWRLDKALEATTEWYLAWQSRRDMGALTEVQLQDYEAEAWND